MDASVLAAQIVATLAPVIPSIVKGASGAAGKELWDKLKAFATGNAELDTAVKDVEADPEDDLNRAALQKAIRKLVASDDAIKGDLEGALSRSGHVVAGDAFIDNVISGSPKAQIGHRTTNAPSGPGKTDDTP